MRRGADLAVLELLVAAQLVPLAAISSVLVRTVDLRTLTAALARASASSPWKHLPLGHASIEGPDRVARVAGAASRFVQGPPSCLVQSVLVFWMLSARGLVPSLQLGVTPGGGNFAAHAWVELAGRVVGEPPETVARFTRLVRLGSA